MAQSTNDICCSEFKPAKLDKKTHVWKNKLFLKGTVMQFMHFPLNMGTVISKMFAKIENAEAMPANTEDFLMLCYDPSPWKSEIHMTVSKEIAGETMVALSGTFLSKVYDGPYYMVPKWMKDMENYAKEEGKTVEKMYFHYAYCPKCAQKYGHNYCVAFAQVK